MPRLASPKCWRNIRAALLDVHLSPLTLQNACFDWFPASLLRTLAKAEKDHEQISDNFQVCHFGLHYERRRKLVIDRGAVIIPSPGDTPKWRIKILVLLNDFA